MAEKLSRPVSEAVARGRRRAEEPEPERARKGRSMDALGGEVRRRDLMPLLVLHLMRDESVYGNRLMGAIEEMTEGMISVNPHWTSTGTCCFRTQRSSSSATVELCLNQADRAGHRVEDRLEL